MKIIITAIAVLFYLYISPAQAFCFTKAGERYHLDPLLLASVAWQESHHHPGAIHDNGPRKGKDYGLMQINSRHIPELIRLRVIRTADDLLTDPCLNVQVGAWILAKHLRTCGVNWECLGSYNAGFSGKNASLRREYARKIFRHYFQMLRVIN